MSEPRLPEPWIARWYKTIPGRLAVVYFVVYLGIAFSNDSGKTTVTDLPPTQFHRALIERTSDPMVGFAEQVFVSSVTEPVESWRIFVDPARDVALEAYCSCDEVRLALTDVNGTPIAPVSPSPRRARGPRPASEAWPTLSWVDTLNRFGNSAHKQAMISSNVIRLSRLRAESLSVQVSSRGRQYSATTLDGGWSPVAIVRYVRRDSAAIPPMDALQRRMLWRDRMLAAAEYAYLPIAFYIVLVLPILLWVKKKCPNCSRKLTTKVLSRRVIVEGSGETLVHGRVTNSGTYDRRYNTEVERWVQQRVEQDCVCSCGNQWVAVKQERRRA